MFLFVSIFYVELDSLHKYKLETKTKKKKQVIESTAQKKKKEKN